MLGACVVVVIARGEVDGVWVDVGVGVGVGVGADLALVDGVAVADGLGTVVTVEREVAGGRAVTAGVDNGDGDASLVSLAVGARVSSDDSAPATATTSAWSSSTCSTSAASPER
ncbi:hypothetical protein A6048_03365 [Dietzia psychralcaliphila]|uniref:Uncharacterized protein n=1 Tax=Dietzia psychralcaliphila TaxID=139021 RepID=A0AAD0JQ40_9ACTN|nr:hypothetical protein A6048_03365 [Dietzia psychralcaliphila]